MEMVMETPAVVESEVEVSSTPTEATQKKARAPRRRPRRTSVDRIFSTKKIQLKRPMTSITSVQKFVSKLQAEMAAIHQKRCCLAQKLREIEELIDKALQRYNQLKHLEINLGGSEDEETKDFKWTAMEKLEGEIISLQEKAANTDDKMRKERAELRRLHGSTMCCRFCSGRLPL